MYADPRLIKKHEVKVRLDDDVNALVDALVKNTGGQKAVIVRDIFLRGLGVVSNIKSADITHA
jgi:predicted DNA-binding protein